MRSCLIVALAFGCSDPIEPVEIEPPPVPIFEMGPGSAPETVEEWTEEEIEPPRPPVESIPVDRAIPRRRDGQPWPRLPEGWREAAWTDDFGLALGRVCFNEANGLEHDGNQVYDCDGIWRVTNNVRARHCDVTRTRDERRITECLVNGEAIPVQVGETHAGEETYLSALRRLSSRVTGLARPRVRRQVWTSTLPADPETPPLGWVECPPVGEPRSGPCNGRWASTAPEWAETLARARGLAEGRIRPRTCRQVVVGEDGSRFFRPIMAWGGEMDDHIAERRGLVRVTCEEVVTLNTFWGRPPEARSGG